MSETRFTARRLFVNALTLSRVPFIFAFMAAAVHAQRSGSCAWALAAMAFMAAAAVSDLFDGLLARRWRVVSAFGKLADPLMDKVFFIVSFLFFRHGTARTTIRRAAGSKCG